MFMCPLKLVRRVGRDATALELHVPFGREVHMWKNWIIFDRKNFLQIVLLKR